MRSTRNLHQADLLTTTTTTTILFFLLASGQTSATEKNSVEFLRTSCGKTNFPRLCFTSLSSYASIIQTNPVQLANTALNVSLTGARSTSTTITRMCKTTVGMKPMEVQAMKDCVENVEGSVDMLKRSMSEMSHLGGQSLGFQISNIQTWVSAALTDANTCMDGFAGKKMDGKVKNDLRERILFLAQLTSNALSFVNELTN